MYRKMIEEYLTHYQPELKADLISARELEAYLEEQMQAMQEAKNQAVQQLLQSNPHMSQLQRELEAEQQVAEMFLPIA